MIIIAYGFRYNLDERSKERCKHIWHGQIYTGYRSRISIKTFDSNAQFERNKRFMMISTRSSVRQRGLGNDASSATTWYHRFSMETTPNVYDVLSGRPGRPVIGRWNWAGRRHSDWLSRSSHGVYNTLLWTLTLVVDVTEKQRRIWVNGSFGVQRALYSFSPPE
jgi:hypothetical protein